MAKPGEHPSGDTWQAVLFLVSVAVLAADSYYLHISSSLYSLPPSYVRHPVGEFFFLLAILLFLWSRRVITHHGEEPKKLLTDGSFSYVRHPVYLASLLLYVGLVFYTLSVFSPILLVAAFLLYDYLASYEEGFLEEKFGKEYKKYKQRTGKWFPQIS